MPKTHSTKVAPSKKLPKKESRFITYKNLDRSGEIALYYGFTPSETPEIKKVDLEHSKSLLEGDFVEEESEDGETNLPLHVEEKVAILRTYFEKDMISLPQPVMLYFRGSFKNSIKKNSIYPRQCDLEILGSSKSITEAILIKTAAVILEEDGYKNICVDINSVGDRDSIAKFIRELTQYYRKNIARLPAPCRQLMKKNIVELLSCKNEKCEEINAHAPKSMSFLSEASRIHFREILEYLEKLGIPYRIKDNLIGNHKYCTETVFEIINADEDKKDHKTLAIGIRYDSLAKRVGHKKEVAGAGISLLHKKSHKSDSKKTSVKIKRPQVYFIQLSFDAKLQSLQIIEILRTAKISVHQSLAKDKLGGQLSVAEKLKIPYTIIMGKMEAMTETVIVRDMATRAQETIKIKDLLAYLKKIKLA